ncbi:MAG: hypothetical protein JO093_18715 [Acidobacteria bacterium]|nr:hypothetical protein [Acidobacteriota bacterium]MBV9187656.1 hypothetical protein [Acidobacteriota bacterium]
MDPQLAIEACIALRKLARANPKVDAYSFISEIAGAHFGSSFTAFLVAAVAHVERAQRVADRFRDWRTSKLTHAPLLMKPDPVGAPIRPLHRFRGASIDVNALISTTVAVRASDRETSKSRAASFIRTLDVAYDGGTDDLLRALVELVERDRRFARRFRSWRRAAAHRAGR